MNGYILYTNCQRLTITIELQYDEVLEISDDKHI